MEKYRVKKVKTNTDDLHQTLDLVGVNKSAMPHWRDFCVYCVVAPFRVGDVIKVYTDNSPGRISMAYSYKLDGRTFIDIKFIPLTQYGFEHFYDNMSKLDALHMKYDVMCTLRDRKIQPTLNAANNLRLLLFNPAAPIKTL